MYSARKVAIISSAISGLYGLWVLFTLHHQGGEGVFNLAIFLICLVFYVIIVFLNLRKSGYRTNGPYDGLVPPNTAAKRELEGVYQLMYITSRFYGCFAVSAGISFLLGGQFYWQSVLSVFGMFFTIALTGAFLAERQATFRCQAVEDGLELICEFRVNKILKLNQK